MEEKGRRQVTSEQRSTLDIGTGGTTRWHLLSFACLGLAMVVFDSTIVNVALPSIGRDLGFSTNSLAWVVNGYLIPYGGFLPLCGRVGDFYGYRRIFLYGILLFSSASLCCGIAVAPWHLICARAVQGAGTALVVATSIPMVVAEFENAAERARAIGAIGSVYAGGGSAGLLLGGVLTQSLDWRWIFWVNIPVGLLVVYLCSSLPVIRGCDRKADSLDVVGAVIVTASLSLTALSVFNAPAAGWPSAEVLLPLLAAVGLFGLFIVVELRAPSPIVPHGLLRTPNFGVGVIIGVLWTAAQLTWSFFCALYLQFILEYDALHVGLAFLPSAFITGALSLGLSAKLTLRLGIRLPVSLALILVTGGLALFARAPMQGAFVSDVLPGMILLGMGGGLGSNPLLLATLRDVGRTCYGVASGIANSAMILGSALALATLTSLASWRTAHLLARASSVESSLITGYHVAFAASAALTGLAGWLAFALLPPPEHQTVDAVGPNSPQAMQEYTSSPGSRREPTSRDRV